MGPIRGNDVVACMEMLLLVLLGLQIGADDSSSLLWSKMDINDGGEGRELAIATDEGDEVSKRLERLLLVGLGALMHRPSDIGEAGGVKVECLVSVVVLLSEFGMEVLLQSGGLVVQVEQLIIGDRAKRPQSVMPPHPRRFNFKRSGQFVPINRMALSVKRGHRSNRNVESGRRGGKVFCPSNSLKRGEMLTNFLPPLLRVLVAERP